MLKHISDRATIPLSDVERIAEALDIRGLFADAGILTERIIDEIYNLQGSLEMALRDDDDDDDEAGLSGMH